MDYYHQIFCRFQKCKRKVPPPSPLSNDFEKNCFFSLLIFLLTRETLKIFRVGSKKFTAERLKLENNVKNTKCLFYYLKII
jgi:hypothetical protein